MCRDILDQLNPEQGEAVSTINGPLLVLAGAGTGKTRVITFRIAYMLRKNILPDNILAMTFTNKAAREMKERLASLVPEDDAKKVTVGTFHSFCGRILRKEIKKYGFTPNFTIIDDADQKGILRQAEAELGYSKEDLPIEYVLSVMGGAKNKLLSPEDVEEQATEERMLKAAKVYKRYQQLLHNQNMLDFDDMLFFVWKLWNENPDILKKYQDIYTHLLVDEYQDTNHAQFEIIRLLAGESMNLCVVGDDDQSIYGWRGAIVENILKFPQHFPGAKEIKLEQNYRSTNVILSTANQVIAGNSNRYNKKLWSSQGDGEKIRLVQLADGEDEAQFIADAASDAVSENPEIDYGDIAVLYRSNHMSQALEQAFRNARIPYRLVGGQEFFKRKEVRDAVAYLKLIVNPRDDQSLLRILGVPPRGIGDKAIAILKELHSATMMPLSELLGNGDFLEKLSSKAAKGASELSSCLKKYRGVFSEAGDLPSKTEDFLNEVGYLTGLQKIYKNINEALVRQENVKSFIDAVARYEEKADGKPTLSEFLESFSLLDENDRTDDTDAENSVTFLTVHASKGLEFPYVFIMGMEAGTFPHDRSIQEGTEDEERRLFYVAITRAKQNLVITNAEKRMKFSRLHKKRIPMTQKKSKFLKEMPEENTERIERNDYFRPMDKSELNKQFEDIFAILDDI